jgi:hypothetical protein
MRIPLLTPLLFVALAGPALAVDGVLEINQACAAVGCFPGDPPGFPVVLSSSGSYRLTGNLQVSDANTTAVRINANDITVDLNGFTISGPTVCSVVPTECSPTGTGDGVFASAVARNATVLNGTVRGMGRRGVSIGTQSRIERVHAISNGEIGLFPNTVCTVSNSTADRNGTVGIRVGNRCLVLNSTSTFNGGVGLQFGAGSGYANNVVEQNNGGSGNPQVSGGLEIGSNVCDGDLVCP